MTRLTKEQAAIIGAFTGIICGKLEDLHEYIERVMKRPVFTHEMVHRDFMEKLKEAAREDFLKVCAE